LKNVPVISCTVVNIYLQNLPRLFTRFT